jgi:nucleotide-binding universal stress UspA family protein
MMALRNVLVAIAFDETTASVLEYGRLMARTFGATLHVLHVPENLFLRPMANDPRAIEDGLLEQLGECLTEDDRRSLHAVTAIRQSSTPADEIVDYARSADIDLIVMGTHGRRGMAHLLMGSVAETVVRMAPCPVMTIRDHRHEPARPISREARHDHPEEHPGRH